MTNMPALIAGYAALLFGIYYCMFGNPLVAVFHGLVWIGMTNLLRVECKLDP